MIIDATDAILGRMAAAAAAAALKGKEDVIIINAENAAISGSRESVFLKYKFKKEVGDQIKGPFMSRMPDRIVRRTIRGMLPWHSSRGRTAFRKVKVYIGNPDNLKATEKPKDISVANLKDARFVYVKDVSRYLGAKV